MDVMQMLDDDKLLIVHRTLARAIGLNAAIVLRQVHYWIKLHEKTKSERHFRDGRYWVYNSIRQWRDDHFEFWSEDTVWRELNALEELGLLVSANFNDRAYDRTKWYTVNYDAVAAFIQLWGEHGQPGAFASTRNGREARKQFEADWRATLSQFAKCISADCENGSPQIAEMDLRRLRRPIPENTTKNTTENTTKDSRPDGRAAKRTSRKVSGSKRDDKHEDERAEEVAPAERQATPAQRQQAALTAAAAGAFQCSDGMARRIVAFLRGTLKADKRNAAWTEFMSQPDREVTPALIRGFGQYWRDRYPRLTRPARPEAIANAWARYLADPDLSQFVQAGGLMMARWEEANFPHARKVDEPEDKPAAPPKTEAEFVLPDGVEPGSTQAVEAIFNHLLAHVTGGTYGRSIPVIKQAAAHGGQ